MNQHLPYVDRHDNEALAALLLPCRSTQGYSLCVLLAATPPRTVPVGARSLGTLSHAAATRTPVKRLNGPYFEMNVKENGRDD